MADTGMGRRIRARREYLGLTLRELARRTDMTPGQLSGVELGKTQEIRTDTLRRLAYHLGVTADWLLGPYEEQRDAEEEESLTARV